MTSLVHVSLVASRAAADVPILPVELLIPMFDQAARVHRGNHLVWSLSLSLVSHAVRKSILPLVYEQLVIDVHDSKRRPCSGWDASAHIHPQLAFLSWLINDPTAAPRQHVKHLIFRNETIFMASDLAWDRPAKTRLEAEVVGGQWSIEHLTVTRISDANKLRVAGLRAKHAHHFDWTSIEPDHNAVRLFTRLALPHIPRDYAIRQTVGFHLHAWAGQLQKGTTMHSQQAIVMRDFSPTTLEYLETTAEMTIGAVTISLQLVDGDRFQRLPHILLEDVVALMRGRMTVKLVLVASPSYRIGGMTVGRLVTSAPTTLVSPDVRARIRISRSVWDQAIISRDPFLAFSLAVRSGSDPWDIGKPLEEVETRDRICQ